LVRKLIVSILLLTFWWRPIQVNCPTYALFYDQVASWGAPLTILDLVPITEDLPGWQAERPDLTTFFPINHGDLTSLGNIVEDEVLNFSVYFWGNDCVNPEVMGESLTGTLLEIETTALGDNRFRTDYQFTPAGPGESILPFKLIDSLTSEVIRESQFKVRILELFPLTIQNHVGMVGTPSGSGLIVEGTTVEYDYQPLFCFENPTVLLDGQQVPTTGSFIMDQARTLETNATRRQFQLTIAEVEGGTVSSSCQSLITCDGTCTLEAIPDACHTFSNWSGDISGIQNPYSLGPVQSDFNIAPVFTKIAYEVNIQTDGNGSTNPVGIQQVFCGDNLVIEATPSQGFTFSNWSGDISSTLNPLPLEGISQDLNITANFVPDMVIVSVTSTAGGGTDQDGVNNISQGGNLTILATADSCYRFAGWSGSVSSTENPLALTEIQSSQNIIANFSRRTQTVEISSTLGGTTNLEGLNTVGCGDEVIVSPSPDPGFEFAGWSGGATGNQQPLVLQSVTEDIVILAHFSAPVPGSPALDPHGVLTGESTITLSGTAISLDVEISGPGGILSVPVTDGGFSAEIPLLGNRKNTLFFTAISNGVRSAPVATTITQDSQPPVVAIQFPAEGAILTTSGTDVAGSVGDVLSGFFGLSVTINDLPAAVDVGIGTNGSFFLENVPLNQEGSTQIDVIATDVLGNSAQKSITVYKEVVPPSSPMMVVTSGNGQMGTVGTFLTDPIEIQILDGSGLPFPNKVVNFKIIRSDGRLNADGAESGNLLFQTRTDENGFARAFWRLGMDAGCGNNRVEVTSASIAGSTFFCASAQPQAPAQINIGTGNDQRVEVGSIACDPIEVWVNDSCNGVKQVPVTFKVIQGSGLVNGESEITIQTGETGHASANFLLGPENGYQLIEANFPGNQHEAVVFRIFGLKRDVAIPTSFQGLVINNAGSPIGGAECQLKVNGQLLPHVLSNNDGVFRFSDIPDGPAEIHVDGLVAATVNGVSIPVGSYPALHFETVVVPNVENGLPTPVKLPKLNPVNAISFDNTQDVTLTVAEIEGLEMLVKAGSMRRADGSVPSSADPAILSLNSVHIDDVPMPMPNGASPPFAWTLQPGGATFDPPVQITYPNMSGLAPGALSFFLSFNHDTNKFEIVAPGTVSEDGAVITSDQGTGLSIAGWGGNCPPYTVTGSVCFGEPTQCVDRGILQEGEVIVNLQNPQCGDLLIFSASGVEDLGGFLERGCPGSRESTFIQSGTVHYSYEIITPSGVLLEGNGYEAKVLASESGDYTCRFYASSSRACPPSKLVLAPISVTVPESCGSCIVQILPIDETSFLAGDEVTFTAFGGPLPGEITWQVPDGNPSSGVGPTFRTRFQNSGVQIIQATWAAPDGEICSAFEEINLSDIVLDLVAYRPAVLDPQEAPIPDGLEESMGVQTWENLDNDDRDGAYDNHDVDGVVGMNGHGDDELFQVEIRLRSANPPPGQVVVGPVEGATHILLWRDPYKSQPMPIASTLNVGTEFIREGNDFIKRFWVEGISPSEQQGTKISAIYLENGNTVAEDRFSITVLGVKSLTLKGMGNGFTAGSTEHNSDVLDQDPNGGGAEWLRVFPGARAPNFTTPNDKILVEVELYRAPVESIHLFLKTFDIDDPSEDLDFVDPNDNGTSGIYSGTTISYTPDEDNRGAVFGNKAGYLEGQDGDQIASLNFSPASNTNKIEFTVTHQPGDNFRVASYIDRDFLMDLRNLDVDDSSYIVDPAIPGPSPSNEMDFSSSYFTKILTVWRLLHVESDSMVKTPELGVQSNKVFGQVVQVSGTSSVATNIMIDINLAIGLPSGSDISSNLDNGGNGRFENGTLMFGGMSFYPLNGNGINEIKKDDGFVIPFLARQRNNIGLPEVKGSIVEIFESNISLNISSGVLSEDFVGSEFIIGNDIFLEIVEVLNGNSVRVSIENNSLPFTLVDDDEFILPNNNDVEGLSIFNSVYILEVDDGGGGKNNDQTVPFLANVEYSSEAFFDVFKNNRGSEHNESNFFWVIYIASCFQPNEEKDGDPDQENEQYGIVWGRLSSERLASGSDGSLIFREAERESLIPNANRFIVAHEVGHQLGLDHGGRFLVDGTPEKVIDEFPNVGVMFPGLAGVIQDPTIIPRYENLLRSRVLSPSSRGEE